VKPSAAPDAKTRRWRFRDSRAAAIAPDGLLPVQHARALVMAEIGRLVADGHAAWDVFDNGDIRLRFHTGETFLLAETVLIRLP
jgi:hypothetical protein